MIYFVSTIWKIFMILIKKLKFQLSKYVDLNYFLRFMFLLLAFYYGNLFYIALIDNNGRLYSAFLHDNLNYIDWLRYSILYTANAMDHAMGIDSFLSLPYRITTINGAYIQMVYECLGFGLISFWMAFVLANTGAVRKKIAWCLVGILSIWFINCIRVAILLMAFEKHWKFKLPLEHHTLFNLVAYTLLALLIAVYVNNKHVIVQSKQNGY